MSKSPPSEDERVAWATLVLATARMYAQSRQLVTTSVLSSEEYNRIGLLMAIEMNTRMRLVKQFGLNLDTVFDRAERLYDEVLVEERAKADVETARHEAVDRLLQKLKDNACK